VSAEVDPHLEVTEIVDRTVKAGGPALLFERAKGSEHALLVNQGSTPTVLYGPGDPFLAHAPDEHVELEDVARCARVLAVWVMRALSAES